MKDRPESDDLCFADDSFRNIRQIGCEGVVHEEDEGLSFLEPMASGQHLRNGQRQNSTRSADEDINHHKNLSWHTLPDLKDGHTVPEREQKKQYLLRCRKGPLAESEIFRSLTLPESILPLHRKRPLSELAPTTSSSLSLTSDCLMTPIVTVIKEKCQHDNANSFFEKYAESLSPPFVDCFSTSSNEPEICYFNVFSSPTSSLPFIPTPEELEPDFPTKRPSLRRRGMSWSLSGTQDHGILNIRVPSGY